jgi:hypothetical protein
MISLLIFKQKGSDDSYRTSKTKNGMNFDKRCDLILKEINKKKKGKEFTSNAFIEIPIFMKEER